MTSEQRPNRRWNWSDDSDLVALRVSNGNMYMEQRSHGVGAWRESIVSLRKPRLR